MSQVRELKVESGALSILCLIVENLYQYSYHRSNRHAKKAVSLEVVAKCGSNCCPLRGLLKLLLPKMLRRMTRLVIDMNITPLDVRQRLQLHLQLFGDVVRVFEGHILVHDNINFYDASRTRVPSSYGVERFDQRRVCHRDICYMLQEARIRRNPDEELEFGICRAEPEESDEAGEDDGTHGINPPPEFATQHAGHEAEAVDDEVVAVILPQDANLTVLVTECPAVEK